MKIEINNKYGKRLKTSKTIVEEDIEVVPVLQNLTITENGTYPVGEGYAGNGEVTTNVQPTLEEITITENGEYTPSGDGFSKVTVDVADSPMLPQLNAPVISLAGSALLIDDTKNGDFTSTYWLYFNGELKEIYDATSTETIGLSVFELEAGTYEITMVAVGTSFVDSEVSNSVSYVVEIEDSLKGIWVFNNSISLPSEGWEVNFASNLNNFIRISVGGGYTKLNYRNLDYTFTAAYVKSSGWTDEAYKTIEITSTYAEVATLNGETGAVSLLTYLQANATKQ